MMRRDAKSSFAFSLALLLAATLCLSLAGCGGKRAELPPLASNAVVLAFGDSLTFGTGAAPEQSYPAQLAKLVGKEIVNLGVPGEISLDGLNRLPAALDEVKPALLILCHGGNDFLRKMDLAATEANLRAMIKLARERNISVLLVATPKPGLLLSTPDYYDAIAKDLNVPLEKASLAKVLSDNSLKSDLVHPNAAGYGRVAEAVAEALRRAGAV
jgi:lysophospholipase L1-like esterase